MVSRKQKAEFIIRFFARLLSIIYANFIIIFSLDVFEEIEYLGFWKKTFALFIHLIPGLIILIIFLLSWKKEWISGLLCLSLAIAYSMFTWGWFEWTVYCVIAGPLIMMGILFLISFFLKK